MQQQVSIEGNTVISCSVRDDVPRYRDSIDENCVVAVFEINVEVSFHENGLLLKVATEREGICGCDHCARSSFKYSSEAKFARIAA